MSAGRDDSLLLTWRESARYWVTPPRPAKRVRVVPSPSGALPLEARQAAWDRLWQLLLASPPADPNPDPELEQSESDGESEDRDTA
jgi:hypothetical protein